MSTIVWRVNELAEQRGFGVRRLADEAGLDEKTVRNIVAGRATRVDLETIVRLSDALKVTPGALWRLESAPLEAWASTAGAAGQGSLDEIDEVLSGHQMDVPDGALDRVARSA